jgi:DNA-binding beta-propeller fold protein YncE
MLGLSGCGASSAEGTPNDNGNGGAGGGAGGAGGAGGSTGTTTTTTPPEKELESSYGAPVATGKFVWITNPDSGRIAYIDAATLEINVIEAGNSPTFVAPVPDPKDDVALVLNVLSLDATLMRAHDSVVTTTSYPVPSSGNGWAVSNDGHFAIAWTDSQLLQNPDPVDGYQDVTVLDLAKNDGTSWPLTVGYRPSALAFDQKGTRAFAVTQDGITVIALDGVKPAVVKNIKLGDGLASDPQHQDVAITPDGSYALLRTEGSPTLGVYSLTTGARVDVTLSGPATDLDMSADGKVAVAVVRDQGEVALLPIPDIAANPTQFLTVGVKDAVIGSASLPKGSPLAFLYTNAVPSSVLGVVDTSDALAAPSLFKLWAPIQAVFPTEDASHAVILHTTAGLPGSQYPAAMSILPVKADLPAKLQGLDGPAVSVAVAPAGDHALVATGDPANKAYRLYVAVMPSLEVTKLTLASQPISAGIVAGANRGYVAQKHPDGRITFVDFKTGEVRTITGFELASQVVDGSGG